MADEDTVPIIDPAVRPMAAGGWRRAVVGVTVGMIAGGLVTRVLPPEPVRGREPGRRRHGPGHDRTRHEGG